MYGENTETKIENPQIGTNTCSNLTHYSEGLASNVTESNYFGLRVNGLPMSNCGQKTDPQTHE